MKNKEHNKITQILSKKKHKELKRIQTEKEKRYCTNARYKIQCLAGTTSKASLEPLNKFKQAAQLTAI